MAHVPKVHASWSPDTIGVAVCGVRITDTVPVRFISTENMQARAEVTCRNCRAHSWWKSAVSSTEVPRWRFHEEFDLFTMNIQPGNPEARQ